MAKCNVLKTIPSSGNAFLTFSQWAEDLTIQNALGDAYRIVPSRFAAFNFGSVSNISGYFNAYFEHPCAALRYFLSIDTETTVKFTPKDASLLFWDAISKMGGYSSNMVYAGELDIQGTNFIDGTTYSEWYATIPTTARKMDSWAQGANQDYRSASYDITQAGSSAGNPFRWTGWPDGTDDSQASSISQILEYSPSNIDFPAVFTCEDNQTIYSSLNSLDSLHQRYMSETVLNKNYYSFASGDGSFNTNAIALFYDIVAKDEHNNYTYLYTAVPMGIYVLNDAISHTPSSDEIYGQGTSYGLRVTTKFAADSMVPQTASAANSGGQSSESFASASVEEILPAMSAVMDRFNAATDTLNSFIETENTRSDEILNHMNSYKDNKVNIPYIREIKDEKGYTKYWFVNGRSTGVPVYGNITVTLDPETGADELADVIQNIIEGDTTNIFGDTIQDAVNNYLTNNPITTTYVTPDDPTLKTWIEWAVPASIASGNVTVISSTVEEIPNTQDLQDLPEDCTNLFKDFTKLTKVPRLEVSNVKNLTSAFQNCKKIESINLSGSMSCENFSNCFNNCENLQRVHIDATSATNFNGIFSGCSNLKDIRIDNIDSEKVHTLDLSSTKCSFGSLINIINSIQARSYTDTVDGISQLEGYISIQVPGTIDKNNNFLEDAIYILRQDKGVDLTIS